MFLMPRTFLLLWSQYLIWRVSGVCIVFTLKTRLSKHWQPRRNAICHTMSRPSIKSILIPEKWNHLSDPGVASYAAAWWANQSNVVSLHRVQTLWSLNVTLRNTELVTVETAYNSVITPLEPAVLLRLIWQNKLKRNKDVASAPHCLLACNCLSIIKLIFFSLSFDLNSKIVKPWKHTSGNNFSPINAIKTIHYIHVIIIQFGLNLMFQQGRLISTLPFFHGYYQELSVRL